VRLAILVDHLDHIGGSLGEEDIAGLIEARPGRSVGTGTEGGYSAPGIASRRGTVAIRIIQDGGHDAGGRNLPERIILAVGNDEGALRVDPVLSANLRIPLQAVSRVAAGRVGGLLESGTRPRWQPRRAHFLQPALSKAIRRSTLAITRTLWRRRFRYSTSRFTSIGTVLDAQIQLL
jgi:hypothetical protein